MRKTAIVITAAILLMSLIAGCSDRDNKNQASPGDISAPVSTPHEVHVGTNLVDVSKDYLVRLCTYPWMDALNMDYYLLKDDGSFNCYSDKELTEVTNEGSWVMYQDEEGYLLLRFTAGDSSFDMCEFELYDSSIYAIGPDDVTYMWLRYE